VEYFKRTDFERKQMLKSIGPTELMIVLFIVLLLFGAKRLPDMARSLGKSARILKAEAKAEKSDDSDTDQKNS
jgi:sec-independent protein translocase protein TatA